MKIKLAAPKPDPERDWHEWFAWYPVRAKAAGVYTVNDYSNTGEYLIWWRYVMRKKVSNTDLTWYLYEER